MIRSANPQALSGRILKKREAFGKNKVSKVSSVISEILRRVSSSFAQSWLVPFSTPSKFHKRKMWKESWELVDNVIDNVQMVWMLINYKSLSCFSIGKINQINFKI